MAHQNGVVVCDNEKLEKPKKKPKIRFTAVQWMTLAILAFGNFCIGACASLQAPFFPEEAEKKGATPTEYGLIFGVFQLTIFITAPMMGKLISFIQPKFLLTSGIFSTGVTCILFGSLEYVYDRISFVTLAFVIRIIEGIGAAALRTSCYSLIQAEFTGSMSTVFAIMETCLGIGLITGPTLGGALYDAGGFGIPFFVTGSLVLVDVLVIILVLPNPERAEMKKKGNMWKFWFHPSTMVYALAIFTAFNYIGYNQATLEPHVRQFNLSGIYLGLMFGLSGACYAISAPCWGWLLDKNCNVQLVTISGCLMSIASLLLIGPMPFLKLETKLEYVIIALMLMGVSIGAKMVSGFTGALQDTTARGFPSDITTYGLISSMIASSQSLGAFGGPSIGGYLLDQVGYSLGTFIVMLMDIVLTIILIVYILFIKRLLIPKGEKPRTLSETVPILRSGSLHGSYT